MNLLTGKIRPIYFKYLSAAFGSALITSVYSIVDMAMVGQYQGPNGTAALAVVAPIWNLIYSLGLLMGIGGSVIFSTLRGKAEYKNKNENEYFTVSVIGAVVLSIIAWLAIGFFEQPMVCSKLLHHEALGRFEEPKAWEIREINEIMNQSITGWTAYPHPRSYRKYGKQRGWMRGNKVPDTPEGFHVVTPEECRQIGMPF